MRPQKYIQFFAQTCMPPIKSRISVDPTKCNLEMVWRMFATLATGCRCFKSLMARCQWPWRMHHRSWQETLLQLQPDVFKYNVAINACKKASQWQLAVCLLLELQCLDFQADVIAFTSALSACQSVSEWQKTLGLFAEFSSRSMQGNLVTFTLVLSAYSSAVKWQDALQLLHSLQQKDWIWKHVLEIIPQYSTFMFHYVMWIGFLMFFYHTFEICVCSATRAGGFLYTIPKHVQMPRCQGSSKCVVRNPQLFSSAGCDLLQCSHWCMWPFWTLAWSFTFGESVEGWLTSMLLVVMSTF